MSTDIVLQTVGLSKRFRDRWAVDDLNLSVRRGEVFGFLGPNGAGKSTTIRMLLSLVTPTRGSIHLFGKRLTGHRAEVLAEVGGLVESPDFYLYLSARRNLEIVAALMGGLSRRDIDEALNTVALMQRADDKVKTYSHGMKQRLGIAQALLGSPEFIILDEPTSGLDPQGIKEVRDLITRLSKERAITVFLSSHLLNEIEQVATSMAIINAGRLVVQGVVNDLLNAGASIVRLRVHPVEQALSIVRAQEYVSQVQRDGEFLTVTMPSERVAHLNATLVGQRIQVDALIPQRSLEEYFLEITEQTSEARSGSLRSRRKGVIPLSQN